MSKQVRKLATGVGVIVVFCFITATVLLCTLSVSAQWIPLAVNTNTWEMRPYAGTNLNTNWWDQYGTNQVWNFSFTTRIGVLEGGTLAWYQAVIHGTNWTGSVAAGITAADTTLWGGASFSTGNSYQYGPDTTQDFDIAGASEFALKGYCIVTQAGSTNLVCTGTYYGVLAQNRTNDVYRREDGAWYISVKDTGSVLYVISDTVGEPGGGYWLESAGLESVYNPIGTVSGLAEVVVMANSETLVAGGDWDCGSLTAEEHVTAITGNFDVLCLAGVCITNWAAGATGAPPPAGTVTLDFEYVNVSALWGGFPGTLYVMAWQDTRMRGAAIYETNFTIAGGAGGLQSDPSYTIASQSNFVGDTYWYAFFDIDEDGIFNCLTNTESGSGGNGLEPAAIAEHHPQKIANILDSPTVKFVMVDQKGVTYRFGWPLIATNDPRKRIEIHIEPDIAVVRREGSDADIFAGRFFWCERDYLYACDDGAATRGGANWAGGTVSNHEIRVYYSPYGAPQVEYLENEFAAISVGGGGTPVGIYPVGAETVTSTSVEFRFTNSLVNYSGLLLEVYDQGPGTNAVYAYSNYMENPHEDGAVRHLMATNRSGPWVGGGTTYNWRVKCVYGANVAGDLDSSQAWSGYQTFVVP